MYKNNNVGDFYDGILKKNSLKHPTPRFVLN